MKVVGGLAILALFSLLLSACPGGVGDPSPQPSPTPSPPGVVDPTEYRYEIEGTGALSMAGGISHTLSQAFAISSNPDFHVPGSEEPCLRVYAYFLGSPLCVFMQLEYSGGSWRAGRSSSSATPYAHIGYGPHPDGFVEALPYYVSPALVNLETSGEAAQIIDALSFSSASVLRSSDPGDAPDAGDISSVSLSLNFTDPLGYAAQDIEGATVTEMEAARFMDTRAYLSRVGADLDAALSADPGANVAALVQALTEGIDEPLKKARVIHDWVAAECAYDYYWYETFYLGDEASPGGYTPKSPFSVLMDGERKTVCGGYALLYWYLCRLAGIDAPLSRGYMRTASDPSTVRDHTWNIIRAGGRLYKVDCTADSRNAWTVEQSYQGAPHSTEWFMPPAAAASLYYCSYEDAHRSEGEASGPEPFYAQYIPPALTAVSSFLRDDFHGLGLSMASPVSLYEASQAMTIDFSVQALPWPSLYLDAVDMDAAPAGADRRIALMTRSGSGAAITLDPPDAGWYCYRLWEKRTEGEETSYVELSRFLAHKAEGSPPSLPFPIQYEAFFTLGVQAAVLPRDELKAGLPAAFDIHVPGASRFYHGFSAWTYVSGDSLSGPISPAGLGAETPNWRIGTTVDGINYSILGYSVSAE